MAGGSWKQRLKTAINRRVGLGFFGQRPVIFEPGDLLEGLMARVLFFLAQARGASVFQGFPV
jgi:hypothetical protein